MKQKLRVFLTLLLCAVASVGWGQTTYKLEQVTEVKAGELYVFEQDNHVMINTVTSSALQTTNTYKKTGLTGTETYVWELKKGTKGFYISSKAKSSTCITNSSSTGISFSATGSNWNFTFEEGIALIQNADNSDRFLGYTTATSYAYKAYATSNLSSYPHAIVVYKLVEEGGDTPSLEDNDLSLSPTSLTFDLYNNSNAKAISYTTSSTGAVTVSASDYVTTEVNETDKTITVTPKSSVTPSAQTITVSQAADDTYAAGSATFTVTIDDSTPVTETDWVETNFAGLTSSDVFVIVGNNGSNYALANDKGASSAPTAVPVTVNGEYITGDVADNIKWNISGNATDGYTFNPYGSTTTWLYCFNNNNGLRVGTGDDKSFVIKDDYIYNSGQERYIGIYNSADWRSYTSINNNIKDQTFKFYKYVGAALPAIVASDITLAYNAISGTLEYTLTNSVEGGILTAESSGSWLTIGSITDGNIALSCEENNQTTARTATVTLIYTYNTDETVTKVVTVTQSAAPISYTTIPNLFDAATSTATDVNVTFNDWVVSGVSTNGKNVFVTDGTNGFVIFDNNGGLNNTYHVGDILSGTAIPCTLKLNAGYAQLSSIDVNNLTISNGGTISIANIALAELTGVNTGALVSYEGLICSVSTSGNNTFYDLSDGTTTIRAYSSLYSFGTVLEDGKTYNVTGVYQQYNTTKEILPRSAADIEEVVNNDPVISVEATLSLAYDATSGVISYTIDNPRQDVTLSADADADWISNFVVTDDKVTFTTTVNEGSADRTATITLSYTGADDKTVTVTQGHYMAPGEWVLTNLADLTENDVFVIVGTYDVDDSSYAMSNNDGTSAPAAVVVTVVENTLSGAIAENLQWNISVADDGYTFYPNGTTESWLYCTNTNNGVKVGTNDNKTFTVSEEGYLVNTATSRYVGIYNSQDWRCYTSINSNIEGQTFSFYKKVENTPQTVEVTISAAATDGSVNYGTLYYRNMNLTVPEGVTAYTASVSNGSLTLSAVTGAIPAGTGVVLKTASKLTQNTPFTFTEATEAGTVAVDNMLLGTDDVATTTAPEGSTGTYKFYALSLNGSNSENSVGFYYRKGCPDGGAFENGAHKAYLAVPADVAGGAKGFTFGDMTDGIEAINNSQSTTDKVYNLAGQRVNKAQKGVYIVNGKKVVIK